MKKIKKFIQRYSIGDRFGSTAGIASLATLLLLSNKIKAVKPTECFVLYTATVNHLFEFLFAISIVIKIENHRPSKLIIFDNCLNNPHK